MTQDSIHEKRTILVPVNKDYTHKNTNLFKMAQKNKQLEIYILLQIATTDTNLANFPMIPFCSLLLEFFPFL